MLTVQEVADKLRVTRQTVYRWIYRGQLKAVRFGGVIRVEERELKRFMGGG